MTKKMVTYRLDAEMLEALKRYAADDRRSATATVELTLIKMLVEAGYMKEEKRK